MRDVIRPRLAISVSHGSNRTYSARGRSTARTEELFFLLTTQLDCAKHEGGFLIRRKVLSWRHVFPSTRNNHSTTGKPVGQPLARLGYGGHLAP